MAFLEFLKAAVIGVIQGITEWLPISSTGHMILADEFIKLRVSPEFMEMFLVVIQLGSILAVLVLYFHKLNPFSPKKTAREKSETWSLWFKVAVAAVPAAIVGLLFNDKIDEMFYNFPVVSIALIVYGVIYILIENRKRKPVINDMKSLTYKTALFIGIFQILALIPGTSRSGSTIIGALLLGTSRTVAAEFSFFLAIPMMFGASAVKMIGFGFHLTSMEWGILLTGMVVAFVVSVFAIRFLMNFIKKHDFKPFGWYRIVLGVVALLYFFLFVMGRPA